MSGERPVTNCCYSSHRKGAHCNGIQPIKVAFGEGLDALIPVLYWPDAVQRGARHGAPGNELLLILRIFSKRLLIILSKTVIINSPNIVQSFIFGTVRTGFLKIQISIQEGDCWNIKNLYVS